MEVDEELEATIKEQVDEWSSNSNECFTIELRQHGKPIASFQPEFTYPIFGDEEAIFGYQDLSITLSFAAHSLRPYVSIRYSKAFPAQKDVQPTDIKEALADFLPEEAFADEATSDTDVNSFRPPGEEVHGYTRDGQEFVIWCASLADAEARQLVERMQILIPMFIEGGSMLQLEQDWSTERWKLFTLYEINPSARKGTSSYSLIGYGTSYRVFTLPERNQPNDSSTASDLLSDADSTINPLDLPSRERLSQFLILPPYQHARHGQQLYAAIYNHLTAPSNVINFTVEDPNYAFDDLRDVCDLIHLRATYPEFAALRINTTIPAPDPTAKLKANAPNVPAPTDTIVPLATRQDLQKRSKIAQRQFDRLVEMHTLSFIPPSNRSRNRITRKEKSSNENDRAYYFWRLYVKARLYIFNRDQLIQVEKEEREDKLEAACDGVLEGYVGLLEKVEKYEKAGGSGATNGKGKEKERNGSVEAVEGAKEVRVRKRKVVDEEDEAMVEDEDETPKAGGKRSRVS